MTLYRITCHVGTSTTIFVHVECWAASYAAAEQIARENGLVPARN